MCCFAYRTGQGRKHEETFYVLDGELRFYLDGEESYTAPAGTSAYIAPGAPHAFEVISDTARWLNNTRPITRRSSAPRVRLHGSGPDHLPMCASI